MEKGQIIYLNGPASAGKSTTARALQGMLDEPYLLMSIDIYSDTLYDWYGLDDSEARRRVSGERIDTAFHHCIAALSSAGHDLIVDDIIFNRSLYECVDLLVDFPVLFVGLHCSLEELERRTEERGDRSIGMARLHFDRVHNHRIYDFEIDSSEKSPLECAEEIKQFVQSNPCPHAFKEIKEKMDSLHQLLVSYADWVRREGILSLKDQPDQPELFRILYEETQSKGRDGRESTMILQAMLLIMEGVHPDLLDRILRYDGKWSDILEEHLPTD